jgi:UDP-N-acetylglucosamine 2-epimerase (non-hydrolysing)
MKLVFVVGARPNFMKVAPILAEFEQRERRGQVTGVTRLVVHTGQHYDTAMSDVFFRDLGMPAPDEYLQVGSGSHGRQTAKVMTAFEDVCERHEPDGVVVVGDVNSTLACALVAVKLGIRVVHVEAGLRSYDRRMPEEINRVLTDQMSDLLLTTSEEAEAQLHREGIDSSRIRFVGNPMIDALMRGLQQLGDAASPLGRRAAVGGVPYVVVTLHRPGNVDDSEELAPILDGLRHLAKRAVVFFPVHPRTAQRLDRSGQALLPLEPGASTPLECGLYGLPPMPYLEFVNLMRGASLILTDSGGIQEETTVLNVPCATLRPNTERPVTITLGTNELVPRTADAIVDAFDRVIAKRWKRGRIPPGWDGHAASRIVDALLTADWLQPLDRG